MTADYGIITEAGTLRFERLLPGPIARVWAYLTESDTAREMARLGYDGASPRRRLRTCLAQFGAEPPGRSGAGEISRQEVFRMEGMVLEVEAPNRLVQEWQEPDGTVTEVTYELAERGDKVALTLTHRRLPTRSLMTEVAGGWHTHLGILEAILDGREPWPFWVTFMRLGAEYEGRIPE